MQVDCASRRASRRRGSDQHGRQKQLELRRLRATPYTYVWKTDQGWADTCRVLVLKLTDDTWHVAAFQFK